MRKKCGKMRKNADRFPPPPLTLATCSALVQNTLPVAWCSMLAAFSLMTDALSARSEWVTVDAQRQGELWIRVGLDGVPLWKPHVVACTICPCSKLKTLPMHNPQRHFVFYLLRGTDSIGVVKDMLAQCKIIEDVGKLNGRRVTIDGKQYVVRVFICGDHMPMYKIVGRDPPSCTRSERLPCPYCDSTPDEVASITIPCPPRLASWSSMFASTPIEQFAIDCSHGIMNVLFAVQLPLVWNVLEDSGVSKTTINELMERVDVDLRALTTEEGSIEGCELQ